MFISQPEKIIEENNRFVNTLYEFLAAINYKRAGHIKGIDYLIFTD